MPDLPPPLPPGRIDIHSHLLPGIDDGCRSIEESLLAIEDLLAAGFVGSVCTPHVWHDGMPENTPSNIRRWTLELADELARRGIAYRLWPGGELRVYDGVIDALPRFGVPTLADSRCVLVDFWDDRWARWIPRTFEWFLRQGYQPILAHPERLRAGREIDTRLRELEQMGVWLQGNTRCMTGLEGADADRLIRQLLSQNRYRFIALDMHGPESLRDRLDGLALIETQFGAATLDRLTVEAPRRWVLGAAAATQTPDASE